MANISQSKVQDNQPGLHDKERQERRIYRIVEGYGSTTRLNCVLLGRAGEINLPLETR